MFKLGISTVRSIIYETCEILYDSLVGTYLAPPDVTNWKKIAEDFEEIWNMPNCISSIDGKHINMECPPNAGSVFLTLRATIASCCLLRVMLTTFSLYWILVHMGVKAISGGIFRESSFGRLLLSGN